MIGDLPFRVIVISNGMKNKFALYLSQKHQIILKQKMNDML